MKKALTIVAIIVVVSAGVWYVRSTLSGGTEDSPSVGDEIARLQEPGTKFKIGRQIGLSSVEKIYTEVTYPDQNGQDIQPWTMYVTRKGATKKVESFERTASFIATSTDEKYLFVSTYGDHYCQRTPTLAFIRTVDDEIVYESSLIMPTGTPDTKSSKIESTGWLDSSTLLIQADVVSCASNPEEQSYSVKVDFASETQSVVENN